jgi:hypothetical protein
MRGKSLRDNPRVGAPAHRHRVERIGDAELLFEGARERASAGATCQYKRTVDVEEKESGWSRADQPSLRTLPARGPFADGSSSKLTRCPSFNSSKLPWTELR